MTGGRYYETSLLTFVQHEQSYLQADGKLLRPTKQLLKKNPLFQRSYDTNLKITLEAAENGTNIYQLFETFVDERYIA